MTTDNIKAPGRCDPAKWQRLVEIMATLRGPEGCPWDKAQDHQSLKRYFLEETYEVLDAIAYANVPQHRERVFIVGFRKDLWSLVPSFSFPEPIPLTKRFQDCIQYGSEDRKLFYTEMNFKHYDTLISTVTDPDRVYQYRRHYMRENKSGVCPTLTANMGTGGHNVPIIIDNGRIRKLSPRECLNFQGFPEQFEFPQKMPYNARYKQAGNSVVVSLVRRVAERGPVVRVVADVLPLRPEDAEHLRVLLPVHAQVHFTLRADHAGILVQRQLHGLL